MPGILQVSDLTKQKRILKMVYIQKVMWWMRNLTIQVTISIFKTLALSNVAHMALFTEIPKVAILELNKVQKRLIQSGGNPKIRHRTWTKNFENGGLENVDILSKIIILLYSWMKTLYGDRFYLSGKLYFCILSAIK